ncbi:MAG: hypothetical protein A3G24_01980 [Betaproteobacteria bacterium RIFCSPLOWO2_12_FULL_62_13]|nr:MAG: hypothetical protein A3G24_01980 [Betaproteobacteria bacterium RIFCSPLOWO2_12_FULL_62_13]
MAREISLHDLIRQTGFEASLITTFNSYLPFYEEVVLPRLRASGCRYNVVLADAKECCVAFASAGMRPRYAGRDYVLVPMQSRGAFHPKVMLFAGRSKAATVVGSHNLTLSGFGYNRELSSLFQFKPGPESEGQHLARQAWQVVGQWVSSQEHLPKTLRDAVLTIRNYAAWLEGKSKDWQGDVNLLAQTSASGSLWRQLREALPSNVRRIVVLGPFFDERLSFLSAITTAFPKASIYVAVDPSTVDLSARAERNGNWDFRDASGLHRKAGYLHAKAIFFDTGDKNGVLVLGSANPSAPAWMGNAAVGNDEAVVVLRGTAAHTQAKALGLDGIAELPKLSRASWAEIAERPAQRSASGKTGRVIAATVIDDGFAIPAEVFAGVTPRNVEAKDSRDQGLLSTTFIRQGADFVVPASPSIQRQASILAVELSSRAEWIAVIHHTQEIRELSQSTKQMQLRAALSALGSDTADLARLISAVEKVVFEEPDVVIDLDSKEGTHTKRASRERSPERPPSLATTLEEARLRRHRRILESGDLAYLLDVLLRQLGIGLERPDPGTDEKGRSEEEQVNQDDSDDELKPRPRLKIEDPALAKLCRGKVSHLAKRMGRQMHLAAEQKSRSPTVLLQLVAVLALLRELRAVEKHPRWVRIFETLVPAEALSDLLDDTLTYLFGRRYQLYQAIVDALEDERFDELARLKGLLIWLAWDCHLTLDDRFSIRDEPEDVEQRLYDKAALLEFALMLRGDPIAQAEASASVLQVARDGAAAAGAAWLAQYSRWATRVASYGESNILTGEAHHPLAPGDLAIVTSVKPTMLRMVSGIAGNFVSLMDFGQENRTLKYVRDKVVRVSR